MEGRTCCVTGHRSIPSHLIETVKLKLTAEIENAINDGFVCFISGFAEGIDQYFAEIVVEKQATNKDIQLEAAIPYRKRYEKLQKDDYTNKLLLACSKVHIVSEENTRSVYYERNRFMVTASDRVIAVYDGRSSGGTAYTIRFACSKGKELREILIASDQD